MAKKNNSETAKKIKKKSKKAGLNKVSMKLKQPPKENPFETIWSRRKFDIIGKKRKGEERRIGQARTHAIEKVSFLDSTFVDFVWFSINHFLVILMGISEEENVVEGVFAKWQSFCVSG